ncbi:hypothetical protein D1872_251340 [compost metagenome]
MPQRLAAIPPRPAGILPSSQSGRPRRSRTSRDTVHRAVQIHNPPQPPPLAPETPAPAQTRTRMGQHQALGGYSEVARRLVPARLFLRSPVPFHALLRDSESCTTQATKGNRPHPLHSGQ